MKCERKIIGGKFKNISKSKIEDRKNKEKQMNT